MSVELRAHLPFFFKDTLGEATLRLISGATLRGGHFTVSYLSCLPFSSLPTNKRGTHQTTLPFVGQALWKGQGLKTRKASTGQSWFRDKGKGVGKEGKGKASKPCFNFQKGFCDRDNCVYSHDVALAGEKGSKGAPGKGSWRQESSDRNKTWKQNQDDQSGQSQQSWQQQDDWRKGEWKSSHDSNKSNWKQDWGQNRKEWAQDADQEARQDWQNRQQNSGKSHLPWTLWCLTCFCLFAFSGQSAYVLCIIGWVNLHHELFSVFVMSLALGSCFWLQLDQLLLSQPRQ